MADQSPASGTRVLVVDDDFDSAEVVSQILAGEGCDVRVALDAREALRVVTDFTPEVAVLDIGLPGADGYALLAALRAVTTLHACRYVALTGYDAPEVREQSLAAGFVAHLVKPVPVPALLRVILDPELSGSGID